MWKMAKFVPIHKRESKKPIKIYRPLSVLPICGKIFKRLIYSEMYPYLIDYSLIFLNQSSFKQVDYCINQFLSTMHEL